MVNTLYTNVAHGCHTDKKWVLVFGIKKIKDIYFSSLSFYQVATINNSSQFISTLNQVVHWPSCYVQHSDVQEFNQEVE